MDEKEIKQIIISNILQPLEQKIKIRDIINIILFAIIGGLFFCLGSLFDYFDSAHGWWILVVFFVIYFITTIIGFLVTYRIIEAPARDQAFKSYCEAFPPNTTERITAALILSTLDKPKPALKSLRNKIDEMLAAEPPRAEKLHDPQEIFEASSSGDLQSVKRLLKQDPILNLVGARGSKGITPLHMAAIRFQYSVAQLLLAKGADVNAQKDDGWTPLHHASHNGDKALVGTLLHYGADPTLRSQVGQTPLHTVAYGISETTIRTLEMEWKATHRKERPKINPKAVIRLLIHHGADINSTEFQHSATPLHLAIFRGQRAAVRELIDCGADLNIRAKGSTPLHIAASLCDEDIVRMLLKKGADINELDNNGHTPREIIGLACESYDQSVKTKLEKLLSTSS